MSAEDQKRRAADAAAEQTLAEARSHGKGFVVGLGTGSTASAFVRALAGQGGGVRCVATSEATAALARSLGLEVLSVEEAGLVDLTVDGADEIAPDLSLIKGGGGALLREKLVWEASRRRLVVADAGKTVDRLGGFPLPIEVAAFAWRSTSARIVRALVEAGIDAEPRLRRSGAAAAVTDGGNYILDVACGRIDAPEALGRALKSITGVVEHGLFIGLAQEAILGEDHGVRRLAPRIGPPDVGAAFFAGGGGRS